MVCKELTTHQRDLIVERNQSGKRYKKISKALDTPWKTVKTVINLIWHNSDITKNWTSLKNWWKDKKKIGPGGCQEAYSNIKGAAGISGKYWLCSACDNNLPYSSYVWAVGSGGKTEAFSNKEKHPSPAMFCQNLHQVCQKYVGKRVIVWWDHGWTFWP